MSEMIKIALSTDVRGLGPNATLLASVLRRTESPVWVRCWCRGFLPESFEVGKLKVEFIAAEEEVSGRYPGHVNEAVFDRLRVIADCLDWERCLILDHDMVVLRDLAEYFAEDFEGHLLMGRLFGPGNTLGLQMKQRGGLPEEWRHAEDYPYFFMGPMMNLAGMREAGTWETFLEAHAAIGQDEQISLTAACGGLVKGVSKRWNLVPQWDSLEEASKSAKPERLAQDGVERVDELGIPWRNGVPAGVIHWTGRDKPWNRRTKVWRPDVWRGEQAGWEHLRMGIWEKPEMVELDPDDVRSVSALAERGWKVRVCVSPGWDRPVIDGFSDLVVESRSELPECDEARIGAWAKPEQWFEGATRLPERLVIQGRMDAAEADRFRAWGYGREFRLVAGEWPAGGPAGKVLDHVPAAWGTGLEAGECLYLRRESAGELAEGLKCEPWSDPEHEGGEERIAVVAMAGDVPVSQAWLRSVKRHFFPGYEVGIFGLGNEGLVEIGEEPESRARLEGAVSYGRLEALAGSFEDWDHVFLLSPKLRVVVPVDRELLGQGLVAVLHPGYHEERGRKLPYERRPESAARVPENEGRRYYTGVLQGGSRPEFLEAVKRMAEMEEADRRAGVEAIWGLESCWNRCLIDTPPAVELGPGYGRSEQQAMEFPLRLAVMSV